MKRIFLSNLALLILLNILIKPFWVFGIDRKVQNMVGSEDYGFYFSLFSFSVLLNILLDVGISNLNNRSIAQDHSIQPAYFAQIVPLKFMLAGFYALVTVLSGLFIGYSNAQVKLLIILIFNQFLLSFILYLRSNISGLHFFRTDSLISVLDRVVMIIICSLLIWGNIIKKPFKIEWFVYAQTISYFITVIITFLIVLRYSGILSFRFNTAFSIDLLKKSYPYAILILLMSFFSRIDFVMLERILNDGKIQAGIYAQSYRILDAVSMIAFLFAGLLLPIFSRMIKFKEPVNEILRLSVTFLVVPALCLAVLSVHYSEWIIDILYNEHLKISAGIFPVLILSFVFISATYIFGSLLTAGGNLKELNILAFTTVLINVVLNFILIRKYEALGAAISNLVSQGFFAITQILLAKKIFQLKIQFNFIFKIIIFTLCLFLFIYLVEMAHIREGTGFILGILVGGILIWVLRIITPSDLKKILINRSEIIS